MTELSKGFKAFLDEVRVQADEKARLLMEYSDKFSVLASEYNDVRLDLERERLAGRHAQERAEKLDAEMKALKESEVRRTFVLVLVDADADAYLFDDKFFTDDPADGGARAAIGLQTAVQDYLKTVDSDIAALPIVARAFASGDGLATALTKAGVTGSGDAQRVVFRFTSGFSQANDMFDFVLVGKGKDRADHKLMASFRHSVEDPSCRHVLLACCHDNGYVRLLEKYAHITAVVQKVTLVKSLHNGGEFTGLPFASTRLNGVFRSQFVDPNRASGPASPHASTATSSAPPHRSLDAASNGVPKRNSPPVSYASRAAGSPPVSHAPGSSAIERAPPVFGSLNRTTILVNAEGHRIDMPLPPRVAAAAESFHRKTNVEGKRYCNWYHLNGFCAGGCGYSHSPLTEAEKLVKRRQLRVHMCQNQGGCRDPLCFYGHHCSCPGTAKKCSFPPEEHKVDLASWKAVDTAVSVV